MANTNSILTVDGGVCRGEGGVGPMWTKANKERGLPVLCGHPLWTSPCGVFFNV